ncbi:MAG: hypothetical protein K8T25_05615 [Planctomycetia bacterium]|nr:hypothetical protein [Planctomycetia bacterium]
MLNRLLGMIRHDQAIDPITANTQIGVPGAGRYRFIVQPIDLPARVSPEIHSAVARARWISLEQLPHCRAPFACHIGDEQ